MSYRSLYRRRRPSNFSDMVGQEHVCRTLSHALSREQLAHAYLFCGPRGTGKTTAAKILACALNCERYPAPEPCGSCPSCLEIASGSSLDVLEMDAASNRGIDEIRELREQTRYAPGGGRYKVYIIDEVHMLTTEAFNAFLKTLEEPPAGVVFILATTDPGKLPATIISRCQRFNFNLLTTERIVAHLGRVVEQEGWQAEKESLRLIARLAGGSMRDALGLLEQAQAYSGASVTAEHVRTITGATRAGTISALVEAVALDDPSAGLAVLHEVLYSGRDLQLFLRDLAYLFSRLLLGPDAGAVEPGFEELQQRFAGRFERQPLLEAAELLYQAGTELRRSQLPQIVLEMALLRLLRTLHGPAEESAAASPKEPESPAPPRRIPPCISPRPAVKPRSKARSGMPDLSPPSPSVLSDPLPGEASSAGIPDGTDEATLLEKLNQAWPKLAGAVRRRKRSAGEYLAVGKPVAVSGNLLLLHFKSQDYASQVRLMENSNRLLVEEVLAQFCRRPIQIKADQAAPGPVESAAGNAGTAVSEPGGTAGKPAPAAPQPGGQELIGEAMRLFKGTIIASGDKED